MTNEVRRRDVVKLAAALAVGAGGATADSALGQQSGDTADATAKDKGLDASLVMAKHGPDHFMLSEPVIFALDTDGRSRDLVITSARDEKGDQVNVYVPSRSMRIFRADAAVDGFTSDGGLYWRFRDKPGKVQLKKTPGPDLSKERPDLGAIVMIVRDEETVRVYSMTHDFRC